MERVKMLERENEECMQRYRETQRKLHDVKRRSEISSANVMLLAGLKKDSVKLQTNINILQKKLNKLSASKLTEDTKSERLLEYYRAQIEKLTLERDRFKGLGAEVRGEGLAKELRELEEESGLVSAKCKELAQQKVEEQKRCEIVVADITLLKEENERLKKVLHDQEESHRKLIMKYEEIWKMQEKKHLPMYSALIPVSYTHLTLPTICSV
eukprot:TRINITY_DN15337_c0_g1_i1.p3 TRINITY_DN15337_c0_g1~~TRINITY_DN15337_c0_g1_i1.p3  ORF type:complete len:212 (-),score=89.73 TRINITY_DN15337_c0_g1_i1:34-669(-)